MKLLSVSDIHGHTPGLSLLAPAMKAADLVVLSGDLTHFGSADAALAVCRQVAGMGAVVIAVSGNCDAPDADSLLLSEGFGLHGAVRREKGVVLAGLGGSPVTPFGTPNEFAEKTYEDLLEEMGSRIPEKAPLVLVSHTPPWNTACDRTSSGLHVGSPSVRRFIEERKPGLCLCGHIHEAAGVDRMGETVVANPGPFGKGGVVAARFSRGVWSVALRSVREAGGSDFFP